MAYSSGIDFAYNYSKNNREVLSCLEDPGGFFRDVGSPRARNKMSALENGNLQFNFINYFLQFVDMFVLCQWLTSCFFILL